LSYGTNRFSGGKSNNFLENTIFFFYFFLLKILTHPKRYFG